MAEYASALIGIAAFGLQICGGLINYYNSYKAHDRAITRLIQDARALHDLLTHVSDSMQGEKTIEIRHGIDLSIEDIVNACNESLKELAAELDKVQVVTIGKEKSVSESLVRGVRRLRYPFKESTLTKLREFISEVKDNLNLAFGIRQTLSLRTLAHHVDDIHDSLQDLRTNQSSIEALKWLHAPDPWGDLHVISRKKHEGTGSWLLDSGNENNHKFRNWVQSQSATFLWIVGFAGTGKSVLASSIIQHVISALPEKSAASFFFFNFRDRSKQSSAGLLKSLVQQLSSQTPASLLENFHIEHQYQQPSQAALLELFASLTGLFKTAYVIVDAIDESPAGSSRDAVIEALNEIKAIPNVHLMVLSRDEGDIRQGLQAATSERISLHNSDVQDDIELFVREHLTTNKKLSKWQKHHEDIERALSEQSNGMFRWVECQFIQLEQCKTFNALQKALSSLPSTLSQTYDRIVANFDPKEKAAILQALTFLCFSSRSLLACELIDAMAIQPDSTPEFDVRDRIEDLDDLLNMLPGLLSLSPLKKDEFGRQHAADILHDRQYHTIHFSHASVKDYFLSGEMADGMKEFHLIQTSAHQFIAKNLLAYTLATRERYHLMQPEERPVDVYPFAIYAIEDLFTHLKQCEGSIRFLDDVVNVFRASNFWIWSATGTQRKGLYLSTTDNDVPTRNPLYCNAIRVSPAIWRLGLSSSQRDLLCAAMFLVEACVVDLASRVVSELVMELKADDHTWKYTSNLILGLLSQVNSFTGNGQDMCRALMDVTPVEHDVNSALYQTMLCRHAYWGDLNTVVSLLPKDSDTVSRLVMHPVDIDELQDRLGESTKSTAIEILLVSLQSRISSPFCCALEGKQWTLVQYFIDNGCLGWCKTSSQGQLALDVAMYAAVEAHSLDHVRLLVSKGANVAYKNTVAADFTPLYRAAVMGELEIIAFLLDHGAEIDARTRFGNTPLHLASRRHPQAARLLIDRGADLTLTNHLGLTCLHFAALGSLTDTIKCLLDAGADPFRRNVAGLTPKELLMVHLHKWTDLWGLQARGSASLHALEEGEQEWLDRHPTSVADESGREENDKHEPDETERASDQRDDDPGPSEAQVEKKISLDDVVDIFIEVPQMSPKR